MIQSMTGYGNTTSGKGSNRFTISIKTVNARFLDIKFKGCDLEPNVEKEIRNIICLLYTSPSPRDRTRSRMPSSA